MARLLQDAKTVVEAPLTYAGTESTYSTQLVPPAAGTYQLEVLALDAANANFGHVVRLITVEP